MDIQYKYSQEFEKNELQELFLSVQWSSGQYPDKLQIAMRNSHSVISAWHDDKLVGLINALSDGVMTAYFHYLLVHPEYQSKGVGKQLVSLALTEYEDYARKILISYDKEVEFYQRLGFEIGTEKTPMFVTFLTT